jgi:uncharacterized protein
MEVGTFIAVALVMFAGSLLQSAAGFGFGMFAIPLLMLLGVNSFEAIAILSVCSFSQTLPGMLALRRHLGWRALVVPLLLAAVFMPIGIYLLSVINVLEPTVVRQVFGCLILLVLALHSLARITPRERLHTGWGALAGSCSGFMSGMSGMGGPPLIMWIMAHSWSNERSRASVWVFFTMLTPIQLGGLWHRFGPPILDASLLACLLAPLALLGLLPGLWLGKRIPKPTLRRLSYTLILFIAGYAIVQPFFAA